jgi:hypothetical protein
LWSNDEGKGEGDYVPLTNSLQTTRSVQASVVQHLALSFPSMMGPVSQPQWLLLVMA